MWGISSADYSIQYSSWMIRKALRMKSKINEKAQKIDEVIKISSS
jgi:hypothetical protein